MRYLLEIVSNNALLYHSLCKNLKKKITKVNLQLLVQKVIIKNWLIFLVKKMELISIYLNRVSLRIFLVVAYQA